MVKRSTGDRRDLSRIPRCRGAGGDPIPCLGAAGLLPSNKPVDPGSGVVKRGSSQLSRRRTRLPIPPGPLLLSPGVCFTVTGESWCECSRHCVQLAGQGLLTRCPRPRSDSVLVHMAGTLTEGSADGPGLASKGFWIRLFSVVFGSSH